MLCEGKSTTATYSTAFLIGWPDHLGGGSTRIAFDGAMQIVPMLAVG